jgi:alpha-tubulin suppressor-like RCC1 family protein
MFAGWGGACSGTSSCSIKLDQEATVIAYFRRSTKMVAVGMYHTCALRPAGDVVCWGRNSNGQVGDGTTENPFKVKSVIGISNAVQIATGGYHSCALLAGGVVQCWGSNHEGALGAGNNTDTSAPVAVTGIADAVAITTGGFHTCALRANSSVACWGKNGDGQLGDKTTTDHNTPQQVTVSLDGSLGGPRPPGGVTVKSISAGGFHTCALLTNSTVVCWGLNSDAQLGVGYQGGSNEAGVVQIPVPNLGTTAFSAYSIAAALGVGQLGVAQLGGYNTCAIDPSQRLYCWGNNNDGQVGAANNPQTLPIEGITGPLVNRGGYLMVVAGAYHVCGLRADGIFCQGHHGDGELGNGTFSQSFPYDGPMVNTAGAYHIAAGGFHSCAVLSGSPEGTVACWGNNGDGQVLGYFTFSNYAAPVVPGLISGMLP